MDEWVAIEEFPSYRVNRAGDVMLAFCRKMIKPSFTDGNWRINLRRNGNNYVRSLARVVCTTYHGKPEPGEIVIFKDGNSENVHADNLCWGNQSFAYELRQQAKRSEPLRNMRIERMKTGEIYENSLEAAKAVNGVEKYIVLAAGDPGSRFYRGSNYRWVIRDHQ